MTHNYKPYFPYHTIRKEQQEAIDFALKALIDDDKKFVIIEAGTGVGKSAIGLTIARYLNNYFKNHIDDLYGGGAYFLTTQKVLQEQYENDFGKQSGIMKSLYSATNYQCKYHKQNDCRTSQQLLKGEKKTSKFYKACTMDCRYKNKKIAFLDSPESVTNFPYFITESTFSGKIKPRNILVIDESHNTEAVLSNFVEIGVSQFFCEKIIKAKFPDKITPVNFVKWILNDYFPKLQAQILHFENQIENLGLGGKLKQLQQIAMRYEMLTTHAGKLESFLQDYEKDNWVMEVQETEKKGYKRVVYRAIDVSKFADSYLFKMGRKVVMLSATILEAKTFVKSLGLKDEDYAAISIPSPFPVENRPIFQSSIGSMSAGKINESLPKIKAAVQAILDEHSGEKGIIHCHTYRIARYLEYNLKARKYKKRLIFHDSSNREKKLKEHINSKQPTVLVSPSMTEGIDLKGDLSRFQVLCKIPYPYLGDPIIKKRMHKYRGWYALQTAKSIVQSCGRSVRSKKDTAITYILDSDWDRFYSKNKNIFPVDFKRLLIK